MTVLRWSDGMQAWLPLENDAPEGLEGARVGLYEVMTISASAYALALHAERISQSWRRLTGRPFAAEAVPPLCDARAEASRRHWPAVRFEVRWFADGRAVAQIRRREKPLVKPPVRLLPMELGTADTAYPHKSVDRRHLTQAYKHAVEAGGDDALFVVGGEIREATQAFIGLVTAEALVLPPLRDDVLPSTTRTAAVDWCRENSRAVTERPITVADLEHGGLIYGNALIGLLPAFLAGRSPIPLPGWFNVAAINRRLLE